MSRANARIYREAARRIAEGEGTFSCNEIGRISYHNFTCGKKYRDLFELGDGGFDNVEANVNINDLWNEDLTEEQQRNRRVLMLLLAAEIEFDGGL